MSLGPAHSHALLGLRPEIPGAADSGVPRVPHAPTPLPWTRQRSGRRSAHTPVPGLGTDKSVEPNFSAQQRRGDLTARRPHPRNHPTAETMCLSVSHVGQGDPGTRGRMQVRQERRQEDRKPSGRQRTSVGLGRGRVRGGQPGSCQASRGKSRTCHTCPRHQDRRSVKKKKHPRKSRWRWRVFSRDRSQRQFDVGTGSGCSRS